jgi:hemerythrin
MKKIAYPDYEVHRKQHMRFIDEVASLKERVRSEMPTRNPITSVPHFMTGWLIDHISRMDSAIGRFFKEKKASIEI